MEKWEMERMNTESDYASNEGSARTHLLKRIEISENERRARKGRDAIEALNDLRKRYGLER